MFIKMRHLLRLLIIIFDYQMQRQHSEISPNNMDEQPQENRPKLNISDQKCPICLQAYQLATKRGPYMICLNQHNVCGMCLREFILNKIKKCPNCNAAIKPEEAKQYRLLKEMMAQKPYINQEVDKKKQIVQNSGIDSNNQSYLNNKKSNEQVQRGNENFVKNRMKEAFVCYNKAIQIDSNNINAHLQLAELFTEINKLYKPQQLLQEILKINPQCILTYINLINRYYQVKKYKQVIQYFEELIKLNPDQTNLHPLYLKVAHSYKKNYYRQKAIIYYKKIMQADPNDLQPQIGLGNDRSVYLEIAYELIQMKRYKQGVEFLRYGIKIQTADTLSFFYLGLALYNMEQYEQAIIYFQLIQQKNNPLILPFYYQLANSLYKANRKQEAVNYFKKHIQQYPDDYFEHFELAEIFKDEQNYPQAIHYYRKAIALNSNQFPANFGLASALKQSNQKEEAIAYYKKCIEIKPDSLHTYQQLGAIFEQMGNIPEAIVYYENVLKINPNDSKANKKLSKLLKKKDQIIGE